MAVTRVDYSEQAVAAAHSVLLELVHLLGEYRDSIVLIGGMLPRLLIPQAEESHIGTVDVDLALDHRRFEEAGYRTVHELLTSRGYERDDHQPFIYRRRFNLEGRPVTVQVDLLSGEYGGTGRSRRTQRVQDVRPRKARGVDLAFEQPLDVEISGALPRPSHSASDASWNGRACRNAMPTTAWQGLFLQSFCIPAIAHGCAGAAKHMDVRERPSMAVRCRR